MEVTFEESSELKINEIIEIVRRNILATKFPLERRTDKKFLAKFIRSKRYDAEKAVAAIHKYYGNLYVNIRLVDGLQPAKYADIYDLNIFRLLKNNFNGAKVVYTTINKWDTKIASLRDLEIASTFILEEVFQDPHFQLYGAIGIIDLAGLGFCHIRQATYGEIKFIIKTGLEMFPLKVAGIHILNATSLFWPIYKIGIKFLPKKIQDRIYFHSNLEELGRALSPDILPKILGGNLKDEEAFDTEIITNIVQRNLPYDCYWNAAMETPYRPRRLSRKRSSLLMC